MFGVDSRTRFRWVVVCLDAKSALLVLGWRFEDQLGIISGKEECDRVTTRENQQLQGCL